MNKQPSKNLVAADTSLLQQAVDTGNLIIIDMRPPADVIQSPVRNAVFMQIRKECVPLLRSLLALNTGELLLISGGDYLSVDAAWLQELSQRRLFVFDCALYALPTTCLEETPLKTISAESLADLSAEAGPLQLLDLRAAELYDVLHITGSQQIPLAACWDYIVVLDRELTFYIYGNDDAEAICFVRLMQYCGYRNLYIVSGGFPALERNDRFYMNGNS